jgi:hypothetical protein
MSVRAIPTIIVAFILYNVLILFSGSLPMEEMLHRPIFGLEMLRGGVWHFTWGDLVLFFTYIMLFIELVKATYTSTASLLDHGFSMLVFVACLIEFLIVPQAATSIFFFVLMATLIDVVAGYTIGIRVARRDLNIGADV